MQDCNSQLIETINMQKNISIASLLYIIVNALFVAKYSSRLFPALYPYITMIVMFLQYIFIRYIMPSLLAWKKAYKTYTFIMACCFISMIILQYSINPYSINVDRWSALYFPIKNLLNGIYPYIAQTHLGGNASPFPIWQLFHIPFYILGNVGLSFFFVLALFLWSIYRQWGYVCFLATSMLVFTTPALWYEVAVRSDYITNILLLVAIINIYINNISVNWVNKHSIILGIVIALFASTRIITLIPIGILLLPFYLHIQTSKKILLPLVFLVTFILTFIPFALWDWQNFFYHQNNPWALQTHQGNTIDFIIFIPLAILLAIKWKGFIMHYYTYVAIMLVAFVGITFLHLMYNFNNWDLFSSTFDITYFNSILPFVMIVIGCNTISNTTVKK